MSYRKVMEAILAIRVRSLTIGGRAGIFSKEKAQKL